MKYLGIHYLFFQLPEGFTGGLSDAMRAFADYHDTVKNTPLQEIDQVDKEKLDAMTMQEGWAEMWRVFCELMREDPPRRAVCRAAIAEHDLADNKLVPLDVNTGGRK